MNFTECGPWWVTSSATATAAPIFAPRSTREPTVSQPVMAPLGAAQFTCKYLLWTRSVELEDSLGRLAPGAGTFARLSTLP